MSAQAGTMQDEATIRQYVKDLEAAWNDGDGQAWGRPFAEDAHYRVVWGFAVPGRKAIAESHDDIFENRYKGSVLEMQVETIRFIRPDVAYVETVNYLHNTEFPFEKTIISMVVVKGNDTWKIVTLNNSGILPTRGGSPEIADR